MLHRHYAQECFAVTGCEPPARTSWRDAFLHCCRLWSGRPALPAWSGRFLSITPRRRPRAMASAYQKEFVMPEEFPATLRDFTREVLRDQPEDVAKYGYEYFLKKMEEAKAKAEGYAT